MMSNMYEYPPPKKPKGSLAMSGSLIFCNNNGKHLGERPLTGHLAEDVWSHLPVSSYDSSKGPTRTPYIPSYMDLSNGPEPCVVCGDAATGYHYRCMTCEGCKGFFRRTIQKNLKYHCKWNGSCIIDKNTRNQCQQCRFTKCLTVGMATDLVLNEKQRIAKRKLIEENRERRRVETMTVGLKHDSCQHDFLTEDDRRLINEIVSAYEHTSVQIPKTYTLPDFNSGNRREGTSPEVWQQLAEIMTPSIVKVVEFAKQVPGFVGLDTSDQILLLKSCCMEIMCLRAACRYSLEEQTLTLQNGLKLKKSQITGGGLGLLVEPIFEFALSLSKLKLDSTEVALLAAVLLMQSDRTGLKIPEAVERLQDAILGAYKRYIAEQRPHQPVHWAKILMKVTDLRTISTRHAERVLCIKLDCPSDIPPLFLEMFDETGAGKAKGRDGEVEAEVSNAVKQLSGEVSGKDSVPYYRPLSNERNTSPVSSESSVSSAGRMSPPQNMVMHNRLTVRRASAAMMSQALSEVRSTQRFSYPTSPSLYTDGMNTPTLPLTPSSLIPPLTPTSPIHIPMSPPGSVPMMNGLISPSVMSRRMSVGALGNLPVPLPISMISAVNSLPVSPPFYSNSVIESSRKSPNAPKSN